MKKARTGLYANSRDILKSGETYQEIKEDIIEVLREHGEVTYGGLVRILDIPPNQSKLVKLAVLELSHNGIIKGEPLL